MVKVQPVDQTAINVLIENRNRFRSFLSRRVGSEAIADEILQDSLLKAIKSDSTLRDAERVLPWFYRVLRNALTDHYRSASTEMKGGHALLQELRASESDKTPAMDELGKAICQCFEGLLPTLLPNYAILIKKIDLGGESPDAVAHELGISTSNLWVRLHRARLALRKSLEKACGACSKHACLECTCRK